MNAAGNLALEPEGRSVVWDQSDALVFLSYTAFSSAIVITVWGAARIARELEKLSVTTSLVLDGSVDAFRRVNSVVGPVLASVATALAFGISGFVAGGWVRRSSEGHPGSYSGWHSGASSGPTAPSCSGSTVWDASGFVPT